MKQINRTLQWVVDNALFSLLYGGVSFSVTWAIVQVCFLLFAGDSIYNFPIGVWIVSSVSYTAGMAALIYWLKNQCEKTISINRPPAAVNPVNQGQTTNHCADKKREHHEDVGCADDDATGMGDDGNVSR